MAMISKEDKIKTIKERTGLVKENKQGSLMKIIEYINTQNVIIEFQDDYKHRHKTTWSRFLDGSPYNPYHPTIFGVGMSGIKRYYNNDNRYKKEYRTWYSMLKRCFDEDYKKEHPTYIGVTCCKEWLLFDNFCDWIQSQENYDKWASSKGWNLDKDILLKGNKIYSPDSCCLVPQNVNTLFVRKDANRGDLPIGVCRRHDREEIYLAVCSDRFKSKTNRYIFSYLTIEEAFAAYKKHKEKVVKQVAEDEYQKGNITKACYEAMMNYEVEITD